MSMIIDQNFDEKGRFQIDFDDYHCKRRLTLNCSKIPNPSPGY